VVNGGTSVILKSFSLSKGKGPLRNLPRRKGPVTGNKKKTVDPGVNTRNNYGLFAGGVRTQGKRRTSHGKRIKRGGEGVR